MGKVSIGPKEAQRRLLREHKPVDRLKPTKRPEVSVTVTIPVTAVLKQPLKPAGSSILEAAAALGRLGGAARSQRLTPERRAAIARAGGLARAAKLKKSDEPPKGASLSVSAFAKLGGLARAQKLTPERRQAIARLGAKARWPKKAE